MNARKVLSVLGIIGLLIIASIVAVALFKIKKDEEEANRKKTEPARANRWKKEESALSETKSPPEESVNEDKIEEQNFMNVVDENKGQENI